MCKGYKNKAHFVKTYSDKSCLPSVAPDVKLIQGTPTFRINKGLHAGLYYEMPLNQLLFIASVFD